MASGWGHALAAAVNGYVDGKRMAADAKEAAEERAWRQEQRAAQRDELRSQQALRTSLADAARPAEVVEGELSDQSAGPPAPAGPTLGDAKPVYRIVAAGGKNQRFDSADEAQKATDTFNAPEGVSLRQAAAYRAAGRPGEAAQVENLALQNKRNQVGFTREQEAYAKELQAEGVMDGLKAFRRGDAAGMVAAFNKSGQFKIDGDVAMKPEDRELPGIGKVPTYSATFNLVGPDGQSRPVTYNSHDLSMQFLPFEKQHDLMLKGRASDARSENQAAMLDLRRDQLANQQALGLARVEAANAKTAARADGTRARADSLQTLIKSNDQELTNVRSQLNGLKGSVLPNDVAAVKDLRERERTILADRREMVTELRTRVMPGLSDALPAGAPSAPATPADRASAPASAAPARRGQHMEAPPSRQAESDRQLIYRNELIAAMKRGNEGDIAALKREIARLPGSQAQAVLQAVDAATGKGPAPANSAVKVGDKAAFDKLPSGTRFVAPDGSVRVKQ